MKRILISIILLAVASGQADYLSPNLEPSLCDRTALGLDKDHLISLAHALEGLTGSDQEWGPEDERLHAQLVCLIHSLIPDWDKIKALELKLKSGTALDFRGEESFRESLKRAWSYYTWLSNPEAGQEANRFAKCLLVVLARLDPMHGLSARAADIQGDPWGGRIKGLAAYFPKNELAESDPFGTDSLDLGRNPDDGAASHEEELEQSKEFGLKSGKMKGIAYALTGADGSSYELSVNEFQFRVRDLFDDESMKLTFELAEDSGRLRERLDDEVRRARERHSDLPKRQALEIYTNSLILDNLFNINSLGAPAAVCLESALSGKKIRNGLYIFGIFEQKKFKPGQYWWSCLKALMEAKSESGLLILPKELEPQLRNLLAFDQAEFFLRFECHFASTMEEVFEMSLEPASEKENEATSLLKKFRENPAVKNLSVFLGSPAARVTLQQMIEISPTFASPQLLMIQAQGRRPTKITTEVLAQEIRSINAPIYGLIRKSPEELRDTGDAGKLFESSKERVDSLSRYVDTKDRALYKNCESLVELIRGLDRDVRLLNSENRDRRRDAEEGLKQIRQGLDQMKESLDIILKP